jgi:hypothetical protein
MRLDVLAGVLAAAMAAGCATRRELKDPAVARTLSDTAYQRELARNNEIKRRFFEVAGKGSGAMELSRRWHTTDGAPIFETLRVNDGKMSVETVYFWDERAPIEMRLTPKKGPVSNLELGYFEGPSVFPDREPSSANRFVAVGPEDEAPAGKELVLRFDFPGVPISGAGRF